MSVSPYLDTVLGVQEGGSAGANLLASMKQAGIATGPYAPYIIGGEIGLNVLGKYMSTAADKKYEAQNYRLGNQQLEIGSLNIEAAKQQARDDAMRKKKAQAMRDALSGIFGEYSKMQKGGQ